MEKEKKIEATFKAKTIHNLIRQREELEKFIKDA